MGKIRSKSEKLFVCRKTRQKSRGALIITVFFMMHTVSLRKNRHHSVDLQN